LQQQQKQEANRGDGVADPDHGSSRRSVALLPQRRTAKR
jgi:hypothetical protein